MIHGEADDLIPIEALHIGREALAQAGLPVEWHVRPGLGHGIDPEGQLMAGHFIAQVLAQMHSLAPARTRQMRDFQAQRANRRRLHIAGHRWLVWRRLVEAKL